jgi:hypothetical protein
MQGINQGNKIFKFASIVSEKAHYANYLSGIWHACRKKQGSLPQALSSILNI